MSELTIPYLAEHQSPDNANGGKPGYNPPPEEKKVLQLVDSLYSKAKKYRKRYDQKWIDWYKMFRGRQWKEVRPSYRHSEVLNLVFETIQSMVPILTDAKPKLEILPTIPSQAELADILTKVADNDWTHNNWLEVLTEIIYDAHFYGTAFGNLGYDKKAEMGLGCIEFQSQDPFYVFPDPNARDVNGRRTKWFITAEPTDITDLKKEYPEKGQFISADVIDFAQGDKADIYQVMFKSPTDSKLIVEGPSGYDAIAKNQTLKITLYSKDDDFEEQMKIDKYEDGSPKLDENGEEKEIFEQRLKYPNGRKIVAAGGVLLEDGDMEYDDGLFPFIRLINYALPREFWGMGEVEQLDSPQKVVNKIISFILDTLTLMGNPMWNVGSAANIDTDNLINKPGLIVESDDIDQVRREAGIEIPGYVLPFLDRYRRFFDGISGVTDTSKGVTPTDSLSGEAISDLQQAAQTRLRLKSRHIDAFLQDFGKLYISRVFQFYSVPRIVRITGDDNANKFFYFHVEKLEGVDQDGNPITRRMAHITDPDGKAKVIEIESDFDVRVSTGSLLPFAQEANTQRAMDLFKLQVIDDEELLKDLNYPNYEAVLKRVGEKKAAAQQQQIALKRAFMSQDHKDDMEEIVTKETVEAAADKDVFKHKEMHKLTPKPNPEARR